MRSTRTIYIGTKIPNVACAVTSIWPVNQTHDICGSNQSIFPFPAKSNTCHYKKGLSFKVQSVQMKNTPCWFFTLLKKHEGIFSSSVCQMFGFPFKANWNKCINFVFISDNISHILINIWNSFPPPAKTQSWCKQLQ